MFSSQLTEIGSIKEATAGSNCTFCIAVYKLLITLFMLTIIATASVEQHHERSSMRPDLMSDFTRLRTQCDWKLSPSYHRISCPGVIQECLMNVTFPEGSGLLHISRLGPYSTKGGFQQVNCVSHGFAPPKGSWLTRSVVGPVDPHTGNIIGFPPLHIHHMTSSTISNANFPSNISEYMPFLLFHEERSGSYFFGGAADRQCASSSGGTDCMYIKKPDGYGRRVDINGTYLAYHVQDVRRPNSPLISFYIDFAAVYITEPSKDRPPIKPIQIGRIDATGKSATYLLEDGKAMYNFVSYHIPTAAELVDNHIHWHTMEGDEAWIVRGSQADLGIPEEVRRPVVDRSGVPRSGMAVEVPDGDIAAFKSLLEEHLDGVAAEYEGKLGDDSDERSVENSTFVLMDELPPGYRPSRPPQILCKYYGRNDEIKAEQLSVMEAKLKESYGEYEVVRPEGAAAISLHNLDKNPLLSRRKSFTTHLNTRDEQLNAMYAGALPGMYYRAAEVDVERAEDTEEVAVGKGENKWKYPYCEKFNVLPGEQLTLIHFNVPRVSKKDDNVADTLQFMRNQHSMFFTSISAPLFQMF